MKIHIFQKGFNFSQDGPGNRLVYHLQGCNLRCPWCANPEGLALSGGETYEVDMLIEEIRNSRLMFFDGGGVTLTGGEVTLQFDASKELLTAVHAEGINTCIETNGLNRRLPELFPVLDELIMDIKHYSGEKHREVTGLENDAAVENVISAIAYGQKLELRIPMIGGFNASTQDAQGFAELFDRIGIKGKATIELLSYHEFGRYKYDRLGMEYLMTEKAKVSAEQLHRFKDILLTAGFDVINT